MKLPKLLSAIDELAERDPGRVAIIADGEEWTYKDLWDLVVKAGEELTTKKLPQEVPVAVTAFKSAATLALIMALGKRGNPPLALSPGLGDSVKPAMFKPSSVYCELSAEISDGALSINIPIAAELQEDAVASVYTNCDAPMMLTTSGSTGVPKVVALSADGVSAFFDWAKSYFEIFDSPKVLSYAPLNFDLSLLEVWATLAFGGTVIFSNPDKAGNPEYLADLVSRNGPDLVQGVPMFYSLLCEGASAIGASGMKASHVIFTGDMTPQNLRQKVADLFPSSTFHNVYGCTETNDSFVHSSSAQEVAELTELPLGEIIRGADYRIFGDDGKIVEGAGEGELHTSTPFLAKGYTDPYKTVAAFYNDDTDGRRYYRTGDRVARDQDGTLTLLGRTDHIVKVRGVRTNLLDIEQAIGQSEMVKEVVVIPVDDDLTGTTLHAVIEPSPGKKTDGLALRMLCSKHLPKTAIPRFFHVRDNPTPRTSTGKPDRKNIAKSISKKEA